MQSAKTRPGADCGSDHELLIAKFRLKESRENHETIQVCPKSNPLRLYSGSENRFKGLDLIDREPDELWTEICDSTGDRDQDHPQEKEMQKSKMLV